MSYRFYLPKSPNYENWWHESWQKYFGDSWCKELWLEKHFNFLGLKSHSELWVGTVDLLINKMYLNILPNSDDLLPSELKYFGCLFELIHEPICHCQNLLEFCQNSLNCEIMICETLMFETARMRDWCSLVKTVENSWSSSATKTSLHNLPV